MEVDNCCCFNKSNQLIAQIVGGLGAKKWVNGSDQWVTLFILPKK
jgi:hypothetical protein